MRDGFRPFAELEGSHLSWGRSSYPIFQYGATEIHTLEEHFALLGSTHELFLSEDLENFANLFLAQLQALIKVFSQRRGNQKVVDVDAAEFL